MSELLSPKRFLSLVLLSTLFVALQSFTYVQPGPGDPSADVIVVIEPTYFNVTLDGGPIYLAGNPAAGDSWVKVFGIEEISSFAILNKSGQMVFECAINSQSFKFMTRGLEPGIYYLQFNMGGEIHSEILAVDR